jgi:hypothetical protein
MQATGAPASRCFAMHWQQYPWRGQSVALQGQAASFISMFGHSSRDTGHDSLMGNSFVR